MPYKSNIPRKVERSRMDSTGRYVTLLNYLASLIHVCMFDSGIPHVKIKGYGPAFLYECVISAANVIN
jgi:hypothetical protein